MPNLSNLSFWWKALVTTGTMFVASCDTSLSSDWPIQSKLTYTDYILAFPCNFNVALWDILDPKINEMATTTGDHL